MFLMPVRRPTAPFSRSVERLLDANFERFLSAATQAEATPNTRTPALDVSETDKTYILTLDLPGIAKEAVKITIDGRRVSIEASPAARTANEGEKLIHSERINSAFNRQLVLPTEVTQAESSARMDQGVLTLTLAKRQPTGATQLNVL